MKWDQHINIYIYVHQINVNFTSIINLFTANRFANSTIYPFIVLIFLFFFFFCHYINLISRDELSWKNEGWELTLHNPRGDWLLDPRRYSLRCGWIKLNIGQVERQSSNRNCCFFGMLSAILFFSSSSFLPLSLFGLRVSIPNT